MPSSPPAPNVAPPLPPNPLAAFLADWPLYRTYKYLGNLWLQNQRREYSFSFPNTLRLYCLEEECKTTQVWEKKSGPYLGGSSTVVDTFTGASFKCRNCQRSEVHYFLHFNVNEIRGEITKVGQWPPLGREPDPVVCSEWGRADVLLYRDAMTFRNANKGIAALPYLRRIIEKHIHDILDLLGDANQRKPIPGFDQAKLASVRNSHRFSEKLDFAREYLPTDLTPSGSPNPIGTLYELISDGLHERTEEECVDVFDRCRTAFEYIVKKLTEAKREDEAYLDAIHKLNQS